MSPRRAICLVKMSWKSRLGRGLMIWISLVIRVLGTFAIAGPFLRQEEMVPSSPPNAGPLFLLIPGNSGRFLLAVISHGAPQRRFDRTAMSPANLIQGG